MRVERLERSVQQVATFLALQQYGAEVAYKSALNRHELGVYSQNGEDGILLFIFSMIGTTSRTFVEFGIGAGFECNSANLIINFGWQGLMLDIDAHGIAVARNFYQHKLRDQTNTIRIVHAAVTAENINQLLVENGVTGQIDLLSIDIDGNDYWVWQAIEAIQPRVVVIEYNASFGIDQAVTIAYRPDFARYRYHPSGFYHGASLKALARLAEQKGYVLVGCESSGANAFFVRKELAQDRLPAVSPEAAFFSDSRRMAQYSQQEQFALIQHLALETVE